MNFENTYVSISSPSESEPFVCEHAPKSPSRKCYAFVPISLSYRHIDASKRRMTKFLETALAGTEGFGIILSLFSLVAAGGRAPGVKLVLVCTGRDGKPFLLCALGKSICGASPRCGAFLYVVKRGRIPKTGPNIQGYASDGIRRIEGAIRDAGGIHSSYSSEVGT